MTKLHEIIENFVVGYHIAADNAYIATEHMLTSHSGKQKKDPKKDCFNFYLSQFRIRIEQAFGMLVNKFRVFKKGLEVKLRHAPTVIEVACRLRTTVSTNEK